MEITPVMRDVTVVLAIATGVALLLGKLRIASAPAFLIGGAILGPTGAGLVSEPVIVEMMAEFGVALFLFTVGLDISVMGPEKMPRKALWAGTAQVAVAVACTVVAMLAFGVPAPEAIFIGFVVSLSSTAIVLKVYSDRMELDTGQARVSLGILILQDMAAIPMMLMIPSLRQWETAQASAVFVTLAKAGAGVAAVFLLARVLIPRLVKEVVRLSSRELLALTVLLICLGTAFLANRWGLSLGMGAFLAGLVISESDYVHEIAAQVMPFRDVFNGVSFISVGMLVNLPFVGRHILPILGLVLAVMLFKAASSGAAIRFLGYSWRIAVISCIGLAQIGEFSYLILFQGYREGLVSSAQYQYMLAIAILSMVVTPFEIEAAPWLARRWEKYVTRGAEFPEAEEETAFRQAGLENHVIISGYGMNGKNLARVLKAVRVPYVVVDLNDAVVREGRAAGEPMFYGDVNRPEILDRIGIAKARMFVLAISDPMATRRAVAVARRGNEHLFILVRTRYVADVDDLLALGANAVIPEEFETSVEIFSRVLGEYHVPDHVVRQQEALIRSGTYRILREREAPHSEDVLAEFEEFLRRKVIEIFYVSPNSPWEGKTVGELPMAGENGIVLLSILRGEKAVIQPSSSERLVAGDKLVLFGGHAPLAAALEALARR